MGIILRGFPSMGTCHFQIIEGKHTFKMLSRITCKSGLIKQVLAQPCLANVAVVSVRNKTFTPTSIEEHLANWEKANEKYFGPERDHVNFPHAVQAETSPPVRMGWIPESWFTALYDKLGVTGPYTLGVGLLAFLMSKELWVFEEHFAEMAGFFGAAIIIQKNLDIKLLLISTNMLMLMSKKLL